MVLPVGPRPPRGEFPEAGLFQAEKSIRLETKMERRTGSRKDGGMV